MYSNANGGRKRARSPDAECEECMPISKRIHNLNIRSRACSIDEDGIEGEGSINNGPNDRQNCCCTNNTCRPKPSTSSSTEISFWPAEGTSNHHLNSGHSHLAEHNVLNQSQSHPAFGPSCEQHSRVNMMDIAPYEPELDATANPHYYHPNRLLYDAHNQRIRRFKPNSRPN